MEFHKEGSNTRIILIQRKDDYMKILNITDTEIEH